MILVDYKQIRDFFISKLSAEGLPDPQVIHVVDALVNASLFGIDSHGVRLFIHYLECLRNGRVESSNPEIIRENGVITVNANNSFAHSAAQLLLRELDYSTDSVGVCAGSILNSDHYGASGIHAFNSSIKNKLIMSFTNADALANTPDGKSVIFGTNPISLVYQWSEELLYIDMATTKFSMNKVKNYRLENKELPENVGRDIEGNLTRNPFETVSLEPIGGHKGFVLAFIVELLTSGLTGMSPSYNLLSMYGTDTEIKRGVSHTFLMINPDYFHGGRKSLESLIEGIRKRMKPSQKDTSPGLKEMHTYNYRRINGVPVDDSILNEWKLEGFKLEQS